MSWFAFAIIGHLANGAAFVIDKALLTTAFKRSATYAGLVGLLSFLVVFAIPWIHGWPHGSDLLNGLASGITFVLALWAFFAALARAEASRVVPIVGSLIPVLTLAGTFLFLGERLSITQILGFVLLIIATTVLSGSGGAARPSERTIGLAIASAALFAVSSVTGKAVYDAAGFFPGFVTTRLAAGATALVIVTLGDAAAGSELLSMVRPSSRQRRTGPVHAAQLALVGQMLGAVGFLFVQIGIARGSAAIVNALQAVQYAFLVIAAFVLRKRAPQLLGESLDTRVILTKIFALVITAAGLALVV